MPLEQRPSHCLSAPALEASLQQKYANIEGPKHEEEQTIGALRRKFVNDFARIRRGPPWCLGANFAAAGNSVRSGKNGVTSP